MRSTFCATLGVLIALAAPAAAQPIVPGAAFYTLADLQTILVQNQARLNLILSTAGSKTTKAKPS